MEEEGGEDGAAADVARMEQDVISFGRDDVSMEEEGDDKERACPNGNNGDDEDDEVVVVVEGDDMDV